MVGGGGVERGREKDRQTTFTRKINKGDQENQKPRV